MGWGGFGCVPESPAGLGYGIPGSLPIRAGGQRDQGYPSDYNSYVFKTSVFKDQRLILMIWTVLFIYLFVEGVELCCDGCGEFWPFFFHKSMRVLKSDFYRVKAEVSDLKVERISLLRATVIKTCYCISNKVEIDLMFQTSNIQVLASFVVCSGINFCILSLFRNN